MGLQLRREYRCFLRCRAKSKVLFVFAPEFCPILNSKGNRKRIRYDFYVADGLELAMAFEPPQNEHRFGPWTLRFEREENVDALNDKTHRIRLEDIADGQFHYFLPLLDEHGVYAIDKTKTVRKKLKCLRGLPKGMKEILPLLIAKGKMQSDAAECVKVIVTF